MTHARFLVNPAAGRGAGGRQLALLQRHAVEAGADVVVSRDAADLAARARRAADDGVERLIVVGGDGTVHHAVQGLVGSGTALAVVPLGSGNDFANAVGAPSDPGQAVELALTAPVRHIDLGRVEGGGGVAHFAMYCGVGFDSEVTRYANEEVRLLRGPLIYPYAVVRVLMRFTPPHLVVEHDGGVFEGRGMFVTVANGPTFGGGMRIAPKARMDDGCFELVLVQVVSRLKLLTIFPKVYAGRHVDHPEVEILPTRRARIRVDREMVLFGDGEALLPVGEGGVTVEVLPRALGVVGARYQAGGPEEHEAPG